MRKALIVGIDQYRHITNLEGAVSDAHSVKAMLERHADGSPNFDIEMRTSAEKQLVERADLRARIEDLFRGDGEVALFYFAGHGHIETTGGYLCAADCKTGNDGIPLADIMVFANASRFQNKIIILDSCHSGIAGDHPTHPAMAEITEGITVLTASTAEQYAEEENGSGIFTSLLVDALGGAAANLVGDVTPGSVYAHVDQSLGAWAQRPVFKTNVKRFVSLRKVSPLLELAELRRIAEFFPSAEATIQLDPSYEPERAKTAPDEQHDVPAPDKAKNAIFAILQKYNRVGLLIPEGAPHMWHAAMQSKSVRLTALGEHYRKLASKGLV